jgi:hypothetical protein
MAGVNHGSDRNKNEQNCKANAGKRGDQLYEIFDIKNFTIEAAEHENGIEGPQKRDVRDQVTIELDNETRCLIGHPVSLKEDNLIKINKR